jgi:hypothetical protein
VAAVNELLRSLEEGASLFGLVGIGETPGLAAIGLGLILLATMIMRPEGLTGGREAGELRRGRWRGAEMSVAIGLAREERPAEAAQDGTARVDPFMLKGSRSPSGGCTC